MDRAQIKQTGKSAMQANFGLCILVSLIIGVSAGGGIGFSFSGLNSDQLKSFTENVDSPEAFAAFMGIFFVVLMMSLVFTAIGVAISALIFKPLEIGCRNFFYQNIEAPANANLIGSGFKGNYKRNALAMFLVMLFTWLWSLLFIIPGIIMGYAYRMVPYIVAEDPEISAMDAIKKSKDMMKGHKWEAFVFDLSFIGWNLLGFITCGIVSVIFVNPYYNSASAVFYKEVKRYYEMQNGTYRPSVNSQYDPMQTYQGYTDPFAPQQTNSYDPTQPYQGYTDPNATQPYQNDFQQNNNQQNF